MTAAPPAPPAPPMRLKLLVHSAFYRFVHVADPPAAADQVRARAHGLHGAIVVAHEGINGTVAGTPASVAAFEAAMQAGDIIDGALRGMPFKHSACDAAPFDRLKVSVKPEIVALGLPPPPDGTALPPPDEADASHLSPEAGAR